MLEDGSEIKLNMERIKRVPNCRLNDISTFLSVKYEGTAIYWNSPNGGTEYYPLSVIFGLRDLNHVATRTLRNGADLARLFSYFYGLVTAKKVEDLFTQHTLILSEWPPPCARVEILNH